MANKFLKKSLMYSMSAASLLSTFAGVSSSLMQTTVHAANVSATENSNAQIKTQVVTAQSGSPLNLKSFISNFASLPKGTKVVMTGTKDQETIFAPTDSKVSFHNLDLDVVYPDGHTEKVPAELKVVAKDFAPDFVKHIEVKQNQTANPYSVLAKGIESVPEGAKLEWDVPAQVDTDGKKAGTYDWNYTYIMPSGTTLKGVVQAEVKAADNAKVPDATVKDDNGKATNGKDLGHVITPDKDTNKDDKKTSTDNKATPATDKKDDKTTDVQLENKNSEKPAENDLIALGVATGQANLTKQSDVYKKAATDKQKAYDSAIEAAQKVQADNDATAKQVKAATDAVNKAQADLATPAANAVNKKDLDQMITDAQTVQETHAYRDGNVTKKSALDAALKTAQNVSSNKDATKPQVDNAMQALQTAMNSLKTTDTSQASVETKAALQKTIDKANKAIQEKSLNGVALSNDQITNLNKAIVKAQSVLNNPQSTEKDVMDATKELENELANPNTKVELNNQKDQKNDQDEKSTKQLKNEKIAPTNTKDNKSYPNQKDNASYPDKASYPSRLPQTGESMQGAALGLTGVAMLGLTALGLKKKRD